MNLIITMAGIYSRFKPFSFQIPKYLLPISNSTILSFILKNFLSSNEFSNVLLVANKRDIKFKSQVVNSLKQYEFGSENVIFIEDTEGQAQTALIALEHLANKNISGKVCIHNADTILLDRDFGEIKSLLNNSDCVVDIFNSKNKSYSYVKTENSRVKSIREKVLISNEATSGLYCFNEINLLKQYLENTKNKDVTYISEIIREMIENSLVVNATKSFSEKNTIVVGTPEQYINESILFNYFI